MIAFENVVKTFRLNGTRKVVLDGVNCVFPPLSRVGVLGMNGAGKTTLLRLISGGEPIDSGRIRSRGYVSFPVGFSGTFSPMHSARDNVAFLARIYGMNPHEVADWVEDFAELGHYFDLPVASYSSGMFARVAFGTSFAFDFDVYLVDEAIEVGDARFRAKCALAFKERLKNSSLVLVSQHLATIQQYCTSGAVLHGGALTYYDTLTEAFDAYENILRQKA